MVTNAGVKYALFEIILYQLMLFSDQWWIDSELKFMKGDLFCDV